MQSTRALLLATDFPNLRRARLNCLQVNLGYTCNLSCSHCHVNAGPSRTEQMSRETVDQVIGAMTRLKPAQLDLTGGAPELNPHFRYLIEQALALGIGVIDRCNLTILLEPGQEDTVDFFARSGVDVVASLPCYGESNVADQRGKGVFEKSIEAIRRLNAVGYGKGKLKLDLVYNPNGAFLPPAQRELEAEYKRQLWDNYRIEFDQLLTLTNMPISRFGAVLLAQGRFEEYMGLLKSNFSADNLDGLMCRNTLSVDWQGFLYDCDFNQMLDLPIVAGERTAHISKITVATLAGGRIKTGDHCYGCAAGQGSSCGGALN